MRNFFFLALIQFKMGNIASAAQNVVAKPSVMRIDEVDAPKSHVNYDLKQTPPPECPMHQKATEPPVAVVSECPIGGDAINPLNMVKISICSFKIQENNFF